MANWLQRFKPKSAFARGVGVLVGGTAGAQALMVLAAPLLTRLYSPEDFGLLAVFTAILALFGVIAAGRYELAIPLPESDQEAANLTMLGFVLVVLTSAATFVVFLMWPQPIADALNVPGLAPYLWLIPIGVFFLGSYEVFSKWAIRCKQFPAIARTRIVQAIGTLGVQLGAFKLGVPALLGGHTAGQGLGACRLALSALKCPEFRHCSLFEMRQQAVRHRRFPLYSSWTAIFGTASLQLAPLMLVALFGTAVAGLYALTLRILSIPSSLIGNAVGNVFMSSAPGAHRNGSLKDLVRKLHSRLAIIGALPLAILCFWGPEIFEFFFGAAWRESGVYAQWMAPWIYFHFQWVPLSAVAIVLEQQRGLLISEAVTLAVRFLSLGFCAFLELDAIVGIKVFAIVSAFLYLCRLLWFLRLAGLKVWSVLIEDVKYISLAIGVIELARLAMQQFSLF